MRFNQLQLVRYGHFTDHTLNFPAVEPGAPDIHIVYGRNEAGKSTISNAIMDFLYGIPAQSKYAFVHTAASLEVSAQVVLPNGTQHLSRLKNQLRDQSNKNIDSHLLDTHNLSRADYKSRFWFDDVTLHEGGESILNNKGELGAALFAATTGLNTLSEQLNALMQKSDDFYKPRKRVKVQVVALQNELKEVRKNLKSLDSYRATWALLSNQRKTQLSDVEHAKTDLQSKRVERNKLDTIRISLKKYHQWKSNQRTIEQRTLEGQSNTNDFPEQWNDEFMRLRQEHYALGKNVQLLNSEIASLNEQLQHNSTQSAWEENRIALDELRQSTGLYSKEKIQIKQLNERLRECQKALELTKGQLSTLPAVGNASDAAIINSSTHELEELIESWKNANTSHQHLTTTLIEAKQKAEVTANNDATGELPNTEMRDNIDRLLRAIDQGGAAELVEAYKQQKTLLANHNQDVSENQVAVFAIGLDSSIDLHGLTTPSVQMVRELVESRKEAARQVEKQHQKTQELQTSIDQADAQLKALGHNNSTDLNAYNHTKDQLHLAWSAHCELIQSDSPPEALEKQAEDVTNCLSSFEESVELQIYAAENIGQINSVLQSQRLSSAALIEAMNKTKNVEQAQFTLSERQDQLISHLPKLSFDDSAALINWLDILELWRTTDRKRTAQQAKLLEISTECETTSAKLSALIQQCELNNKTGRDTEREPRVETLAETLARAKSTAKTADALWNLQEQAASKNAELNKELSHLKIQISKNEKECTDLSERLAFKLSSTWLKDAPTGEVAVHWSTIKRYQEQLTEQTRIATDMTQATTIVTDIETRTTKLSKALDIKLAGNPTDDLHSLSTLHEKQLSHSGERNQHTKRINEQTIKLNGAIVEIAAIDAALKPMHERFNTTELDDLLTQLNDATDLRKLQIDQAQVELEICEQLRLDSFLAARVELDKTMESFENSASEASNEEPQNENENTRTRLQLIGERIDERISSLGVEETSGLNILADSQSALQNTDRELEKIGLDEKYGELRQKEADLIHEIEEGVLETLKLRLGLCAIERGLQHFRDQNRSGMLEAAKQSFKTLTQGNYIDLVTRPDAKGVEKLIATRHSGESVGAENLSVGTRYQLYLALRIAAYHEYRGHRTPLPFVADDIFETFDEPRTQCSLSELAEMGKHGQVIYFTHHKHVADIARNVIPNVNTIELP